MKLIVFNFYAIKRNTNNTFLIVVNIDKIIDLLQISVFIGFAS